MPLLHDMGSKDFPNMTLDNPWCPINTSTPSKLVNIGMKSKQLLHIYTP